MRNIASSLAALAIALAAPLLAADFYASPNGSSGADGSLSRPWDLATALAGRAGVRPGDTIWLRGGRYTFPLGGDIRCGLRGTASAPITVAQYPGERATLDVKGAARGLFFTNSPNPAGPAYVHFKDFEVTNSETKRVPRMSVGIWTRISDHLKFINLIIHDTGEGFYLSPDATNTEVYGCVVYYNGVLDGLEHGIYIQNVSGYKKAIDNIVFNNAGFGIHAYPHKEDAALRDVSLIGNIAFNNGLFGSSKPHPDILLGGQAIAISPVIDANATYKSAPPGNFSNQLIGYGSAGCSNPTVTNNYFVGMTVFSNCTSGLVMNGNTFNGKSAPRGARVSPSTPVGTARRRKRASRRPIHPMNTRSDGPKAPRSFCGRTSTSAAAPTSRSTTGTGCRRWTSTLATLSRRAIDTRCDRRRTSTESRTGRDLRRNTVAAPYDGHYHQPGRICLSARQRP